MFFSLPIITTPVFGIVEQVKENISALFYAPGDIQTLAQHITTLYHNRELANKLGENARIALNILPTLEEMSLRYEMIFKEAWLSGESR